MSCCEWTCRVVLGCSAVRVPASCILGANGDSRVRAWCSYVALKLCGQSFQCCSFVGEFFAQVFPAESGAIAGPTCRSLLGLRSGDSLDAAPRTFVALLRSLLSAECTVSLLGSTSLVLCGGLWLPVLGSLCPACHG